MEPFKIQKPYPGQKCGLGKLLICPTDQYRFSRTLDAMYYAQFAGIDPEKIFDLLHPNDKADMNDGDWEYYPSTEK